jgi:hypothetical protein
MVYILVKELSPKVYNGRRNIGLRPKQKPLLRPQELEFRVKKNLRVILLLFTAYPSM